MRFSTQRTVGERARLFAAATVLVTFAAFAVIKFKFLPRVSEAVVVVPSVVVGLVAALFLDRMVGASIHLLRVARLGTNDEQREVVSNPPAFGDPPIQALVAVELGDLSAAELLLKQDDDRREITPQQELAQMRYAIVAASGAQRRAILERILAWRATHGGLLGVELERYRAFVLAGALVDAPVDGITAAAAKRLTASKDEHVRAYGTWLTTETAEAAGLPIGAALARHHGRVELANQLDIRASVAAASGSTTPYRGREAV